MYREWVRLNLLFVLAAAFFSSALTAAAFLYFSAAGPAIAQAPLIPNTGGTTIPDVVDRVNPSVVSIVVTQNLPVITRGRDFFGMPDGDTWEIGSQEVEVGGGSGFVANEQGYIFTNKHVVSRPDASYTVLTNDGKQHAAAVVYRDPDLDVAILRIDAKYPALTLADSDEIRVGQTVIAVGNALAEFRNTVSVGIISGLDRSISAIDPSEGTVENLDHVIQTDAAINKGNSGGPLLDANGRVIGMNVAVSAQGQNIGFAIPSNDIQRVLDKMR